MTRSSCSCASVWTVLDSRESKFRMTSPVDTSVKYFTSLMSGAPALSGTAGSMIAVLDACLKDGFDQKALTSLTVAGGVATAAYTGAHSAAVDSVVFIAGVTGGPAGWAGLNGEQKITGKGAASVTFATNLPDGAYTGAATMKMAPLGWLKPFANANLGAYKSNDPASTGMLLRVDDSATTVVRVVGYELMTDINTGVGGPDAWWRLLAEERGGQCDGGAMGSLWRFAWVHHPCVPELRRFSEQHPWLYSWFRRRSGFTTGWRPLRLLLELFELV